MEEGYLELFFSRSRTDIQRKMKRYSVYHTLYLWHRRNLDLPISVCIFRRQERTPEFYWRKSRSDYHVNGQKWPYLRVQKVVGSPLWDILSFTNSSTTLTSPWMINSSFLVRDRRLRFLQSGRSTECSSGGSLYQFSILTPRCSTVLYCDFRFGLGTYYSSGQVRDRGQGFVWPCLSEGRLVWRDLKERQQNVP